MKESNQYNPLHNQQSSQDNLSSYHSKSQLDACGTKEVDEESMIMHSQHQEKIKINEMQNQLNHTLQSSYLYKNSQVYLPCFGFQNQQLDQEDENGNDNRNDDGNQTKNDVLSLNERESNRDHSEEGIDISTIIKKKSRQDVLIKNKTKEYPVQSMQYAIQFSNDDDDGDGQENSKTQQQCENKSGREFYKFLNRQYENQTIDYQNSKVASMRDVGTHKKKQVESQIMRNKEILISNTSRVTKKSKVLPYDVSKSNIESGASQNMHNSYLQNANNDFQTNTIMSSKVMADYKADSQNTPEKENPNRNQGGRRVSPYSRLFQKANQTALSNRVSFRESDYNHHQHPEMNFQPQRSIKKDNSSQYLASINSIENFKQVFQRQNPKMDSNNTTIRGIQQDQALKLKLFQLKQDPKYKSINSSNRDDGSQILKKEFFSIVNSEDANFQTERKKSIGQYMHRQSDQQQINPSQNALASQRQQNIIHCFKQYKQNQLPFIKQPLNEMTAYLMHNRKKLALDLIELGFKDDIVEHAIKYCFDKRIEALVNFIVPDVAADNYSMTWNHQFVPIGQQFVKMNKDSQQLQAELFCPQCLQIADDNDKQQYNIHQLTSSPLLDDNHNKDSQYIANGNQEQTVNKLSIQAKQTTVDNNNSTLIVTSNYIIRNNSKLNDFSRSNGSCSRAQLTNHQKGEIHKYFNKVYNQSINKLNESFDAQVSFQQQEGSEDRLTMMALKRQYTGRANDQDYEQRRPQNNKQHDFLLPGKDTQMMLTQSLRSLNRMAKGGEDRSSLLQCEICSDSLDNHSFDYNLILLTLKEEQKQIHDQEGKSQQNKSILIQDESQQDCDHRLTLKNTLQNNNCNTEEIPNTLTTKMQQKYQKHLQRIALVSKLMMITKYNNRYQNDIDNSQKCMICFEVIPETPQQSLKLGCDHQFCSSCFSKYLQMRIEQFQVTRLKCPCCQFNVNSDLLELYLSNDENQKLSMYKANIMEACFQDNQYCYNCGNCFQKYEISPTGLIQCDQCEQMRCLACGREHLDEKESCLVALERDYKLRRQGALCQICPNCDKICGIYQKCQQDHLYCTHCKVQFCIFCRKTGISSNGDHWNPFSYDVCELIKRPQYYDGDDREIESMLELQKRKDQLSLLQLSEPQHSNRPCKKQPFEGLRTRDKVLISLAIYIVLPLISTIMFPIWASMKFYNNRRKSEVPYYKLSEQDTNEMQSNKNTSLMLSILILVGSLLLSPLFMMALLFIPVLFLIEKKKISK